MKALIERIAQVAAEVAAPRIKEAEEAAQYWKRQSDTWRGIAAEMGYEPKAHIKARPTARWLLDRIAKYRQQIVDAAHPQPVAEAGQVERMREAATDSIQWMARAYERIHCLPRNTDTALADGIEASKARLRQALAALSPSTEEKPK